MDEKAIGHASGVDTGMDVEKIKHVDPTMEKHSHDADDAMKAIEELHGETIELDEATNRRLLKIIDWHMMPIMCFIYGMNYLDSTYSITLSSGVNT
jgi:ACS family allantoate permease-like MFS transporter